MIITINTVGAFYMSGNIEEVKETAAKMANA
jgi:hypothetical protein